MVTLAAVGGGDAVHAEPGRLGELLDPVLRTFVARHPEVDVAPVLHAARIAAAAHEGQFRRSGEPYITHPIEVAGIVAELGLDAPSVTAALLHDAVEDGGLTLEALAAELGPVVAAIVDGVTKLDRLQFDSKEQQQAATIRKMLLAMASDWRVLLIKLADRLHNMRTLGVMPEWKQRRIATETFDVYAPLAHRLGVQQVRWQLEDLAFATLHPRRYAEIEQMVAVRAPQREEYLARVIVSVRERLAAAGIEAEVTGRPKHLWSIYEKMVVRGKEFDDINDLVAIRVVVTSEKDCWAALGAIHAIWAPVQGRFKDYINSPKFNLYQSLHTTVIGLDGKPIEVQVRTHEMHRRAEYGIAAHWGYKEKEDVTSELAWMQRIADVDQETADPVAFLEALKLDLEQDEVYVFTPKGKVIALPARSTPVDFAYAIHTEVGHRCIGARVNGRLVPLDSRLASADTVEIFTSKSPTAGPSRDWLGVVASSRARNKIRQWFSRERREDAIETGREELAKALRREGMPLHKVLVSSALSNVASSMNLADVEALFASIGEHQVSPQAIVQRLVRELRTGEPEQLPTTVTHPIRRPRRSAKGSIAGLYVEGLD
ncbi:MAG TPA: bifunctional (p)ppGpp synthetase/guanosine-3',5'-bis(diphosphate) 3'-pyrophosphohydrolase, partial [Acidimicrobiales bacterium]|nr:bifunctional (p)ppGpp synthetase/guanosine-3',5'-bis(diphosphate) 3'-pyrophosphohydrolase [Acidimicrobiales bacterium]